MSFSNDLCADIAGERFNVSWLRTSPMLMIVHDNFKKNFINKY